MKEKVKGYIAGLLSAALISGATIAVAGKQIQKTAQLYYNNIKICIDGTYIEPKDANGNTVEPFIIDGTTYLPVRAVAGAFGKDVNWDGNTNTVILSAPVPSDTPIQAYKRLVEWILNNGTVYGEYVYIENAIDEWNNIDIRYYPGDDNFAFTFSSYANEKTTTTMIFIHPTYDGSDVFATYISGTDSCRISGDINMVLHSNNYPLAYRECTPGEFQTVYNLLEATRIRINTTLAQCNALLSANNTKVSLNTLGFKMH